MSRLADYFAIVGYDHANDRKEPREGLEGEVGVEGWAAAGDGVGRGGKGGPVIWTCTLGQPSRPHACTHARRRIHGRGVRSGVGRTSHLS